MTAPNCATPKEKPSEVDIGDRIKVKQNNDSKLRILVICLGLFIVLIITPLYIHFSRIKEHSVLNRIEGE